MSYRSRWEYFRAIYGRYRQADRKLKRVILNEFCAPEIPDLEDFVRKGPDAHSPELKEGLGIRKGVLMLRRLLEVKVGGFPNHAKCNGCYFLLSLGFPVAAPRERPGYPGGFQIWRLEIWLACFTSDLGIASVSKSSITSYSANPVNPLLRNRSRSPPVTLIMRGFTRFL